MRRASLLSLQERTEHGGEPDLQCRSYRAIDLRFASFGNTNCRKTNRAFDRASVTHHSGVVASEQMRLLDAVATLHGDWRLDDTAAAFRWSVEKLVPVDMSALCFTHGSAANYHWFDAGFAPGFFGRYFEMSDSDFIRASVIANPNRIVADDEMISRLELRDHVIYRISSEFGTPIERVASVATPVEDAGHGGLTLYRVVDHPFQAREINRLRPLTQHVANWVRTQLFLTHQRCVVDCLRGESSARAVSWYDRTGREVYVSDLGARVLTSLSRASRALIRSIVRNAAHRFPLPADTSECLWAHAGHEIRYAVLSSVFDARPYFGLLFRAHPDVPPSWQRKLTPRQNEVVALLLAGYDNKTIGDELGCATPTVKKHISAVLDRLGLGTLRKLYASALERTI